MNYKRATVFTCALLAAGLMFLSAGCPKKEAGKTGAAEKKTVLATFDGGEVTAEEINTLLDTFDPGTKMQLTSPQVKDKFLSQLIDAAVLAKAAEKKGLDKDPKTQTLLNLQRNYVLASQLFTKEIKPAADKAEVSDADVKQYYDTHPEEFDQTKIKARLVTAQSEAEAQDIYKQLSADIKNAGKLGKDKVRDMGWISRGQNFPEMEKVAFGLQKGQVSAPIQTHMGWMIVIVDDKSESKMMPFEQVKDSVKYKLSGEKKGKAGDDAVEKIRKEFKLKVNKDKFSKVGEGMQQNPHMMQGMPGAPSPH